MAEDPLGNECAAQFQVLVDSVGTKRFANTLGLSTRQINRILSGAQPNPIERVLRSLQCCPPEVGDQVVDFICREAGGYFVRQDTIDNSIVNAVKECAEAIAAISDGTVSELDEIEIREAVSALITLARAVREQRKSGRAGAADE